MVNPLQVATDGYIAPSGATKTLLIIALAGLLSFGSPVPPVDTGGGGDDYSYTLPSRTIEPLSRYREARELTKQNQTDEEELLIIMSVIMRWL